VVPSGTHRRLVLLRHAKSAWPHGVPDHDRPLAGKGRRNAKATGRWFATEGPRPELVICSDAVRARHTWEIAAGSLGGDRVPVRSEPALYRADPLDLLGVVHEIPERVKVAVVVGHEPTLGAVAMLLSGAGSDPVALARLRLKFPTNGVAVLRFRGCWAGLVAGCAALESFAVPRQER
jgi:phosphohistidine phosphatase